MLWCRLIRRRRTRRSASSWACRRTRAGRWAPAAPRQSSKDTISIPFVRAFSKCLSCRNGTSYTARKDLGDAQLPADGVPMDCCHQCRQTDGCDSWAYQGPPQCSTTPQRCPHSALPNRTCEQHNDGSYSLLRDLILCRVATRLHVRPDGGRSLHVPPTANSLGRSSELCAALRAGAVPEAAARKLSSLRSLQAHPRAQELPSDLPLHARPAQPHPQPRHGLR